MPSYYRNVPGWGRIGSYYENVVPRLPPNPTLVEIGVWQGRSAIFMAELLKESRLEAQFYLVDSFDGGTILADEVSKLPLSLREALERHIDAAGVREQVTSIIALPSVEAAKQFDDLSIDFAFVDADHDYESVRADLVAWWPKIKMGGILSGHDYVSGWRGVSQAVDEQVARHRLEFQLIDDVWEIRKQPSQPIALT